MTYRTVHGDKDTFRAAFHLAGKPRAYQQAGAVVCIMGVAFNVVLGGHSLSAHLHLAGKPWAYQQASSRTQPGEPPCAHTLR